MTWRATLAALAGTTLPELPPVTSTRRHRLGDDYTQMSADQLRAMSLREIACELGISRAAACERRRRCRLTGDWQQLLAPARPSVQRGRRREEKTQC